MQYADDTTLFLGDEASIEQGIHIIDNFAKISNLQL